MQYQLLDAFQELFDGQKYLHRRSNLGDRVAMHLYEDLYALGRSQRLINRVDDGLSVLNTRNQRRGIQARRGDGSFGEVVPNAEPITDEGFSVLRGPLATIEVGIEVKILMKAMIKQIDRVGSDLREQARHFRSRGGTPICVGVVGINYSPYCITYEGERAFRTDGRKYKHPIDEAEDAEARLLQHAAPNFDEFIILRFRATNEAPFPFDWVREEAIQMDYGAVLARISSQYEVRA